MPCAGGSDVGKINVGAGVSETVVSYLNSITWQNIQDKEALMSQFKRRRSTFTLDV